MSEVHVKRLPMTAGIYEIPAPSTPKLDRFWDVAIKLTVPLVLACGAALISHEVRLTSVEQRAEDTRSDTQGIIARLDRLIEKLETLGNRMTALESKIR